MGLLLVASLPGAPARSASAFDALLAADGLTRADLPTTAELTVWDSQAGVTRVTIPIAEAIREIEEGAMPGPVAADPDPAAHTIVGGQNHACSDGIRLCYKPLVESDQNAAYVTLRNAWNGATTGAGLPHAVSPFPFASGTVWRVRGQYTSGSHAANATLSANGLALDNGLPGTGDASGDRSVAGVGVGTIRLIAIPWGSGNVISYGRMSMQGAFDYCVRESSDQCAGVSSAVDSVNATAHSQSLVPLQDL